MPYEDVPTTSVRSKIVGVVDVLLPSFVLLLSFVILLSLVILSSPSLVLLSFAMLLSLVPASALSQFPAAMM